MSWKVQGSITGRDKALFSMGNEVYFSGGKETGTLS
jgi:hypothetical protein